MNVLAYVAVIEIITCVHVITENGTQVPCILPHLDQFLPPLEEHAEQVVRSNDTEYPSWIHPDWLCTCHKPFVSKIHACII